MHIKFIRPLLNHASINMDYDLYYLSNESFTMKEISSKSPSIKKKSLLCEKESVISNKRRRFSRYQYNNPISFRMISCKQWDVLKWF